MSFVYVDFIAPNVDVCVKYLIDGESRWYDGTVLSVLDRYVDDDSNVECVKCIVAYDHNRYTETLKETDYNCDSEEAWCFGNKFIQLVEQIKFLNDDNVTKSFDSEDVKCTEDTISSDETEEDETEEDETEEDETEVASENEDKEEYAVNLPRKKSYSLVNNIGAVLFMLSPWIASAMVLYNARHEIIGFLQKV